jgi:hypothetical protein
MTQAERIKKAVGEFGASAKAQLSGAGQQPEDQFRSPLEELFKALALECNLPAGSLVLEAEMLLAKWKEADKDEIIPARRC